MLIVFEAGGLHLRMAYVLDGEPASTSQKHATLRKSPSGRVEDGRGSLGPMANAPFPIPARQTGRADFRHPAFRLASPQGTRRPAAHCRCRATTPRHVFAKQ